MPPVGTWPERAMMQDVKAAMELLAQKIPEIEEEEIRLDYLADEFDRARLRGETPDPRDVARLEADKAAFLQRCERINGHIATMCEQADAVTHAMNDCLLKELRRQFNAQFNMRDTPPGSAS